MYIALNLHSKLHLKKSRKNNKNKNEFTRNNTNLLEDFLNQLTIKIDKIQTNKETNFLTQLLTDTDIKKLF